MTEPANAPWRLGHIADGPAESAPDSTALIVGEQRHRISYAQLAELVAGLSERLTSAGLRAGDVLALESTNTAEYIVGLLAAARAGIAVAPVDPAMPPADKQMRVEMACARVILVGGRPHGDQQQPAGCPAWILDLMVADNGSAAIDLTLDAPARAIDEPIPGLTEDDALIMFTSGTTGRPKMVPWTHANLAASVNGIVDAYQLGPDDATVAVMPLFHGHGLVAALLSTLASGGRLLLPARGRFSAHSFWDDIATADASWYTAVPTIHHILLDRAATDRPASFDGRLRFIRSCSAPLPPAIVRRTEATFGAPVLAAYGMTETTHQASSVLPTDDEATRLKTAGTPTSAAVRTVADDGKTCAPGAAGEIWFSGPTVVRGYLNNPSATASTFVDGWLRTGDLGVVDERGRVSVIGRIKLQINRGGEKISPERVEEVLESHPDVEQAVVLGIPDPVYGERVAAVIVSAYGRRPDLAAYSRGRLAGFEIPERFVFADELPLTAKGSVDRAKANAKFAAAFGE